MNNYKSNFKFFKTQETVMNNMTLTVGDEYIELYST